MRDTDADAAECGGDVSKLIDVSKGVEDED